MPERLDKLRATIQELERELGALDEVDDSTRETLQSAVQDIKSALGKEDSGELDEPTVQSRLNSALEDFEASHPALASLISRIIDTLGQIGI